jgi:iron complex transport system substrate-binding protein
MKKSILVMLLLALFSSIVGVQAQEANLAECVAEGAYDAETDYFPDKLTVDYATGFEVEYHNNYKLVTVTNPFPGAAATDEITYVLVQCGTPTPEGYDELQVINVPAESMISLSTTYLPHLKALNLLDYLIGVDTLLYTSTPEVLEMGASGVLLEVGSGPTINLEQVVDAEPDLVMAFASGSPEYDTHPTLLDAGIFTAIGADYVEASPLGRAEWLKFTALFFNAEAEADTAFDGIVTTYNDLAGLTADLAEDAQPLVLWDSFDAYSGAWFVPGSASYIATLLNDAGVNYVLEDAAEVQDASSSVTFDFEVVYDAGINADFWIPGSFGVSSLDDLLAQDERYADFAAFQNGNVFSLGARVNENGGDYYFETGVTNPQLVLADLIKIFHPELLPEHELYFFQQLTAGE